MIRHRGPADTQHEGIFVGYDLRGVAWVIENSKQHGQVIIRRMQAGANWSVIELVPQGSEEVIISRALSLLGKPYHVTAYNCQHFVSEFYTGEPASWQLGQFVLLGGLAALAVWPKPHKKHATKKSK
jgi:hypothetical protein